MNDTECKLGTTPRNDPMQNKKFSVNIVNETKIAMYCTNTDSLVEPENYTVYTNQRKW